MIDPTHPIFAIEMDDDINKGEFVRTLPEVIAFHMRTSRKYFTPSTLMADFKNHRVWVTRQAINSALVSLLRQKVIVKCGRGLYKHSFYS